MALSQVTFLIWKGDTSHTKLRFSNTFLLRLEMYTSLIHIRRYLRCRKLWPSTYCCLSHKMSIQKAHIVPRKHNLLKQLRCPRSAMCSKNVFGLNPDNLDFSHRIEYKIAVYVLVVRRYLPRFKKETKYYCTQFNCDIVLLMTQCTY